MLSGKERQLLDALSPRAEAEGVEIVTVEIVGAEEGADDQGVHRHARRRGVRRARVRAGVDQRDHGRARPVPRRVLARGVLSRHRPAAAHFGALRAASPARQPSSRPRVRSTAAPRSRARSFRQKETRSCSTWTASTWPSRSTASSAPTSRARSISARKRASEERKRDVATSELIEALQALAHERKIDEFYLIDRLEASLAKSYQHILDLEWDARVTIDRQTGRIYVYELVPVGEPDEETGEYSEFEERDVTPADVSRIAAQNAKGVIASIVREAGPPVHLRGVRGPRGRPRDGHGAAGHAGVHHHQDPRRRGGRASHYDAKRNPGERNERPAGEHYRHNQRLKVLIIDVRDPNSDAPKMRGEQARPAIVVSRTHPDLIRRLFEIEGAGDLRRHGGDQVHRPRAGRAHQDRRGLARGEPRPGGRLRRPEGQPRAHGGGGAAQRARGRHPVGTRTPQVLRGQRALAREGDARASSTRTPTTPPSWCPTTSCPWPSARRARTPASPRASPAGTSTSRARAFAGEPLAPRATTCSSTRTRTPTTRPACAPT